MKNKIIKILSIISATLFSCMNIVYAANDYGIYNINENSGVIGAGKYVAGWILYAGIIICVIVLMIKGIKFITSSPEGKADVKKELIPWFVGIVILLAGRLVANWVIELTQQDINSIDSNSIGYINNIKNLIRL